MTGDLPPTPIQAWFLALDAPHPSHFNQSVLLELRAPVDVAALEGAVRAVGAHHDMLRARAVRDGARWRLRIGPLADTPSLERAPLGDRSLAALVAGAQASLDLTHGPLARFVLVERGPDGPPRLLVIAHHLIVDVHSWRILLEDLHLAYAQLARGEAVQLPPKTASFKEWAVARAASAEAPDLLAELPAWSAFLPRVTVHLPRDEPHGENTAGSAATITATLDAESTAGMLRHAAANGRTGMQESLLAALAGALAAWVGRGQVVVDLEGHGRAAATGDLDVSRTVGWFTAPYPVPLELDPDATPSAALAAVHQRLRAVPAMGENFATLRYLSRAAAQLAALPRAEIVVLYLGHADAGAPAASAFRVASEASGPDWHPDTPRPHAIELNAMLRENQLHVVWRFSRHLHRAATIEALSADLMALLRSFGEQPEVAAEAIPEAFADAGLSRAELDGLLAELERK